MILGKWSELFLEYNITYSKMIADIIIPIDLTYEYLEEFIAFCKIKHEDICLTASPINKDNYDNYEFDFCHSIKRLVNKGSSENKLYYITYYFNKCKYGDDFKNVHIVFSAKSENLLVSLFKRFEKTKCLL